MPKPSLEEIFKSPEKPPLEEIFGSSAKAPASQGAKPSIDQIFTQEPEQSDVQKYGMLDSVAGKVGTAGPSALGFDKSNIGNSIKKSILDTFIRPVADAPAMATAAFNKAKYYATGQNLVDEVETHGGAGMFAPTSAKRAVIETMRKTGISPDFHPGYDKVPEWLLNNPASKYLKGVSEDLSYIRKKYPNENAFTLYAKGDPAAAIDWTVNAAAENIGFAMFTLGLTMAGVPAPVVGMGASALAGGMQFPETFGNERLSEDAKFNSVIANALAEGIPEAAGSAVFPFAKSLFQDIGINAGKEALKRSILRSMAALSFGPLEEGLEEFATGVAQRAVDMQLRAVEGMSWKNVYEGALLDGYLGTVSGVPYAAGAAMQASVELGDPGLIADGVRSAEVALMRDGVDTRLNLEQLMEIKSRLDAKSKGMTNQDTGETMVVPKTLSAGEVALLDIVEHYIATGNFNEPQAEAVRALGEGLVGDMAENMTRESFNDRIREKMAKGEELTPNETAYLEDERKKVAGIKGADIQTASSMSQKDYMVWAEDRAKPNPKNHQELLDAKELHRSLVESGDFEAAIKIRENVPRESELGKKTVQAMEALENDVESRAGDEAMTATDQELTAKYQLLQELDEKSVGEITPEYESQVKSLIDDIRSLEERKSEQTKYREQLQTKKRGIQVSEPESKYGENPFKGKWSGVVDLRDGVIEDMFTKKEARENDFHHSLLVSHEAAEAIEAGEKAYFWMEGGKPMIMDGELPKNISDAIIKQIKTGGISEPAGKYGDQTKSSAFKKWFGDSKVVDESGKPKVVYHGTTHKFNEFKTDRGNIENHYGKAFYFTDSKTDVSQNYEGVGPDLKNRIDRRAEQIFSQMFDDSEEPKWNTPVYKKAMKAATKKATVELSGKTPRTIEVFLSLKNPVILDGDGETFFEIEYDEESGDESGSGVELYNAVLNAAFDFNQDGQAIWNSVAEKINLSQFSAKEFEAAMRESEKVMYVEDPETGDLASNELIKKVWENAGFDGIVMDADKEFGSGRKIGKQMSMDEGTKHYVVFDPKKIKSATENIGTFDPTSADITKEPSQPYLPGMGKYANLPSEAEIAHGSKEAEENSIQKVVEEIKARFTSQNVRRAGIVRQLQEVKFVNYSGHVIDGPDSLAQLHQVFRSPAIETFVYYIVKPDGTIAVNRASTSGKVDEAAVGQDIFDSVFADLLDAGEGSKLYLAHNHPSGRTEASQEDMHLTRKFKDNFPRAFAGHVIIDHGKYRFIDETLGSSERAYSVSKDGERQDWRSGLKIIREPESLAEYFDNVLRAANYLHAIFLDKANSVVAYELFNPKETENLFKEILSSKTKYASTGYIILGDPASVRAALKTKALPHRPLDILEIHGPGNYTSYLETNKNIPVIKQGNSVFEPPAGYGKRPGANPEFQIKYVQAQEFQAQYKEFRERVGKMRKHDKGFMAEELSDIPPFYWTKEQSAVTPDVKASELGYESEEALLQAIREAEVKKKKNIPFMKEAKEIISEEKEFQREFEHGRKYGYSEGYKEASKIVHEKLTNKSLSEQEMKDAIVDYANEYLPKDLKGGIITQVRDAKTMLDAFKAFQRADEIAENSQREKLIQTLKNSLAKVSEAKNISIEYKQMIADLADSISFSRPRQETLERLQRTKDYIEAEIKAGREVAMPKHIFDGLRVLDRVPVKDLTLEELEFMIDRVDLAIEIGQTKLRARQFVYEADKERMLSELRAAKLNKFTTSEKLEGALKKSADFALVLNKARAPMDHFFYSMGDTAHRIFKEGMDSKYNDYLTSRRAMEDKTDALIKNLGLDEKSMERIGIYAADQQDGGRAKLLNQYTEAEIDAVKLDAKEKEFYDFMRAELEAVRPQYEKMLREVFNLELGKVANYFPFLSDFEAMSDWEIRDRFANLAEFNPQLKKTVDLGSQKKRVDRIGVQRVRVDAASVFAHHMDEVFYAVHLAEEIKKLQEIARTASFGEVAGNIGQEVTRQWLDVMARKGGRAQRKTGLDRGIDFLRKNMSLSQLAFNPASIALQITATMDGAMLIGNYAFTGQPLAFQSEWRNFALDNSPQLKNRVGDDYAYREFGKNWWGKLQSKTMTPQKAVDGIVATGVWIGAYNKYLDENKIEMDFQNPNKDASDYANRMMTMTQASGSFKDLPVSITRGVGTGGNESFAKALAQYQTFSFFRWANVSDIMPKLLKEGDYQTAAQIVGWWTVANLSEIGIRHGIKGLFAMMFMAILGGKGEYDDEEPLWKKLVGAMFGNIPYVSNLISVLNFQSNPVPILSAYDQIMDSWGYAGKSKAPEKKMKWITVASLQTAGLFGGVPGVGVATKTIKQADKAASEKPFEKYLDRDGKAKNLYNKFKKIRTEINDQYRAIKESPKAFDEKHRSRVSKLNARINAIESIVKSYNKRGDGDTSSAKKRLEDLVKEYES